MARSYLVDLQKSKNPQGIGAKGSNLRWMIRKGLNVPATYALPFPAQQEYRRSKQSFLEALREELGKRLDLERSYAVRSSANLEDAPRHSFAGQFKTFLNVRGLEYLLNAVREVLEVDQVPGVRAYLEKSGLDARTLKMAVLIQEMVQPCVSGVAFSRNPLTGLDEIVIEAVQGSGEALVKEGVTPERWVYKWGEWMARPESAAIDPQIIHQVAVQTAEIARAYGAPGESSPVDLEWVHNGQALFWVQLRPITRLEEINIYSNRISRETFPGMIKPLVWSVNVPLVNSAWIEWFTELIGPNDLRPEELAKSFAYRAYFNMGAIGRIFSILGMPKDALELLMGVQGGADKPRFRPTRKTLRHLPRMLAFLARALRYGPQVMPTLDSIRLRIADLRIEQIVDRDDAELWREIDRLYTLVREAASINILAPLLMMVYNALLKRQLAKVGVDFASFDLVQGMAELQEYDPTSHIRRMARRVLALDDETQARLGQSSYQEMMRLPNLQELQTEVSGFLARFGYLSDSGNDFSAAPWRENPDLVLRMILDEAERLERESQSGDSTDQPGAKKIAWQDLKIGPVRRLVMRPIYRRARQFRLYREAVSSVYTSSYGLFRNCFLELGRRLAERGWLESPEDIFYLEWKEARQLTEQSANLPVGKTLGQLAVERKTDMLAHRDVVLPEIIYGDELPPLGRPNEKREILKGVPSSRGYYCGPARVIRSVSEIDRLEIGDVLVIPYSDVSWAPLFSRAGAVIAESGGILSHSSIVAREYNIPCVVSVAGACSIPDGLRVAVDGYKGEISLSP